MTPETLKFSPALFIGALLCFLLPFVTISCQGQALATFSGLDLVIGPEIQEPSMWGEPQKKQLDGSPLMALVALFALIGAAMGVRSRQTGSASPAAFAGIGLVLLLLVRNQLSTDIVQKGRGVMQLQYEIGFWAMTLMFTGAAALHLLVANGARRKAMELSSTAPPSIASTSSLFDEGQAERALEDGSEQDTEPLQRESSTSIN